MDGSWIKNLAKSTYEKDRWKTCNNDDIEKSINNKIIFSLNELYKIAQDSIEIFNCYVTKQNQIWLIKKNTEPPLKGFTFILNKTQINLGWAGNKHLEASLILNKLYNSKSFFLHKFIPLADRFGDVRWIMDDIKSMGLEDIIKQLLQDLYKAELEGNNLRG